MEVANVEHAASGDFVAQDIEAGFFPDGILAWDQLISEKRTRSGAGLAGGPWPYTTKELRAIEAALPFRCSSRCLDEIVMAARLLAFSRVQTARVGAKANPRRDAQRLRSAAEEMVAAISATSDQSSEILGLDYLTLLKCKHAAHLIIHSLPDRVVSRIDRRFGRPEDSDERNWVARLHNLFQKIRSVQGAQPAFETFVAAAAAPLIQMRLPDGQCALKARQNWWDLLRPRRQRTGSKKSG